ncbi:MAG: dihydropteroate synthase [Myxococcales bacterium]|nr:dihydropteroate synthase [Myxococcales bacterium]MCB9519457.1 dihydropteroate synthase [Myxococcales bacterium]MCB9530805.1 dihydropteroate synthase [Myxococcales bacterium]
MAIVNVTPDSFSDGGRFSDVDAAVDAALRARDAGAAIVDVGGESTRPGATPVSVEDELARVVPVIARLRERTDVVVSVDTTKAVVAEAALRAGADIVNDISGMTFDEAMPAVCAAFDAGCVAMHTPARPQQMDQHTGYRDVVSEVSAALRGATDALVAAGVARDAIAIDPGFGFGKDAAANYELLARLGELAPLDLPVLVGVSRKRMIRGLTGPEADAIEHGTTAANVVAVLRGARIVRVHDVAAAVAALRVARAALAH